MDGWRFYIFHPSITHACIFWFCFIHFRCIIYNSLELYQESQKFVTPKTSQFRIITGWSTRLQENYWSLMGIYKIYPQPNWGKPYGYVSLGCAGHPSTQNMTYAHIYCTVYCTLWIFSSPSQAAREISRRNCVPASWPTSHKIQKRSWTSSWGRHMWWTHFL